MKNFLKLATIFCFSHMMMTAENLKINNKFNDQIYISLEINKNLVHALVNAHTAKTITCDSEVTAIIINFQTPGIAPIVISKEKIPAFLKILTVFASGQIQLS